MPYPLDNITHLALVKWGHAQASERESLSFMQLKNLEIICNLEVITFY